MGSNFSAGLGCLEGSKDDCRESALEAAHRFAVGLSFAALAVVVDFAGMSGSVHLRVRDVVQTAIELPIATGTEPNRLVLSTRALNRRCSGMRGKRVGAVVVVCRTNMSDQTSGGNHRAATQLEQHRRQPLNERAHALLQIGNTVRNSVEIVAKISDLITTLIIGITEGIPIPKAHFSNGESLI